MSPDPHALKNGRPLRVLHCPWNVAGQSAQLAAAERKLGADSRCIVIEETALGFPADLALAPPNPTIRQRELARWRLLWQAISWADVLHFSFGQSCLVPHAFPGLQFMNRSSLQSMMWWFYCRAIWLKDLPVLSALGKTLVVTWQGDDARQHDRSLELFDISIAKELGDRYYIPNSDEWKRKAIAVFEKYAPIHYALNPDLLHVLPRKSRFLPYASFDISQVSPSFPVGEVRRPLIFAHAPSHRGAKGTDYVLAAAEKLKAEGLQFELRLIEKLSRQDAMLRYAESDVIIDQLLAGWYGGLGVEAMALGKPVIAYMREMDIRKLDPDFRQDLPITSATTESIADVMRRFIQMPRQELRELGHASRAFVDKWHDPVVVARRTLSDYCRALEERS